MSKDLTYTINMAYQRLIKAGEKKDKAYMKDLRDLAQSFHSPKTLKERVGQLESERQRLVNTILQQKDERDALRMVNTQYGGKLYDMDRTVNEVIDILHHSVFDWRDVAKAVELLEDSLRGFPVELSKDPRKWISNAKVQPPTGSQNR